MVDPVLLRQIAERLAEAGAVWPRHRKKLADAIASDEGVKQALEFEIKGVPVAGGWAAYAGDMCLCCNVTEDEAQFALQVAESTRRWVLLSLAGRRIDEESKGPSP